MIISIDGPAGSGKSTTAKFVAKKLGFLYIDTGAMYRAATLLALITGTNPQNELAVAHLVRDADIKMINVENGIKVLLNKEDVTKRIRTPEVTRFVSLVSTYRAVRDHLVSLQREMGENNNVVCEGRDIGTVVFPNADIKIYLTCSIDERAKRRLADLQRANVKASFDEVKRDILRRDKIDSERKLSPLRIPEGAITIDTTNLTIEEQVQKVLDLVYSLQGA